MITLTSNQTLYLDEGAVLYATVEAKDADNVRIIGRGILDNSRNKEEILFQVEPVPAEGESSSADTFNRLLSAHRVRSITLSNPPASPFILNGYQREMMVLNRLNSCRCAAQAKHAPHNIL